MAGAGGADPAARRMAERAPFDTMKRPLERSAAGPVAENRAWNHVLI